MLLAAALFTAGTFVAAWAGAADPLAQLGVHGLGFFGVCLANLVLIESWEYGPDADSKTLTIGYRVPGRWAASLSAELRAKGSIGIEDLYPGDSAAAAALTTGPYADPNGARTPTGDHPDRRFILKAAGELSPLPFLTTGGSVAWVHIKHPLGEDVSPLDDAEIEAFVTFRYR